MNIEIVATISSDGSKWKPVWLLDTEPGHDKAQSTNDYREHAKLESDDGTIPMIIIIGNGVSDLSAVREADVLLARCGLRLEEYCRTSPSPTFSARPSRLRRSMRKRPKDKVYHRTSTPAPTSGEEYQARIQSQSSLLLLPETRRCLFGRISSHNSRLLWIVQLSLSRWHDCLSY